MSIKPLTLWLAQYPLALSKSSILANKFYFWLRDHYQNNLPLDNETTVQLICLVDSYFAANSSK
jgi:hypothetical protein